MWLRVEAGEIQTVVFSKSGKHYSDPASFLLNQNAVCDKTPQTRSILSRILLVFPKTDCLNSLNKASEDLCLFHSQVCSSPAINLLV